MCFYFALMNYNGYIIKPAAIQKNESGFIGDILFPLKQASLFSHNAV